MRCRLCIIPSILCEAEFFSDYYAMLKQDSRVSNIMAITGAFVPIISMTIDSISVDIPVIVGGEQYSIPNDYDYTNLTLLDQTSIRAIRSIQGALNTHALRTLIPDMSLFCKTLNLLKFFCKVGFSLFSWDLFWDF